MIPKLFFVFNFGPRETMPVNFDPPSQNHKGPPLWWKFWKNAQMLIVIAEMKRSDSLNTTQKTTVLCNIPFLNKARKAYKKGYFLKDGHIQERHIAERWGSFAVYSVHQESFFWAIKINIPTIFQNFHAGGVKIYRHSFARSKIFNKNHFRIRRASLTPWHMVKITSLCLVANLIALI